MPNYYVNKNAQSGEEHEIHTDGCPEPPEISNRRSLGHFNNCKDALKEAQTIYNIVDGCYYCCNECHTR